MVCRIFLPRREEGLVPLLFQGPPQSLVQGPMLVDHCKRASSCKWGSGITIKGTKSKRFGGFLFLQEKPKKKHAAELWGYQFASSSQILQNHVQFLFLMRVLYYTIMNHNHYHNNNYYHHSHPSSGV